MTHNSMHSTSLAALRGAVLRAVFKSKCRVGAVTVHVGEGARELARLAREADMDARAEGGSVTVVLGDGPLWVHETVRM